MAADSAVTMTVSGGSKIYNGASKIFTLSSHQPVGVMFYGSDSFMGVPWETIIKIFRKRLGTQSHATLHDYAVRLTQFLAAGDPEIPMVHEKVFIQQLVAGAFFISRSKISDAVRDTLESQGKIDEAQALELAQNAVRGHAEEWQSLPLIDGVTETELNATVSAYEEAISEAEQEIFKELPLPTESKRDLRAIAGAVFGRELFPSPLFSGVVICGFGEKEVYPAIEAFVVLGKFGSFLKYRTDRSEN